MYEGEGRVYDLKRESIDCSSLFETQEGNGIKQYKLKDSDDSRRILDLRPLESLRDEDEEFFAHNLFVRDCMQELFNYLVTTEHSMNNIVLGSPGVGKSMLSFVAALQVALI